MLLHVYLTLGFFFDKDEPFNMQTFVVSAHLQRRRLHVQRADPTRWLQHLHIHQTRSLAKSWQPSAETHGPRPGHAIARTVSPSDKCTGADVAPRTPRLFRTSTDVRPKRATRGFGGVVGKALADDAQSQLPQKMRRLLSNAVTRCVLGSLKAGSLESCTPSAMCEEVRTGQPALCRLLRPHGTLTSRHEGIAKCGNQKIKELNPTTREFSYILCSILISFETSANLCAHSVFQRQRKNIQRKEVSGPLAQSK